MEELRVVAANVKKFRLKKCMTQLDLAAASGTDVRVVRRVEAAKGNPTVKTLIKISRELGVSVMDLFRKR